jgi:hypothetical protein
MNLPPQLQNVSRIRKPYQLPLRAENVDLNPETLAFLDTLKVFDVDGSDIENEEFPPEPYYILHDVNTGLSWLVDSQGYSYARYVININPWKADRIESVNILRKMIRESVTQDVHVFCGARDTKFSSLVHAFGEEPDEHQDGEAENPVQFSWLDRDLSEVDRLVTLARRFRFKVKVEQHKSTMAMAEMTSSISVGSAPTSPKKRKKSLIAQSSGVIESLLSESDNLEKHKFELTRLDASGREDGSSKVFPSREAADTNIEKTDGKRDEDDEGKAYELKIKAKELENQFAMEESSHDEWYDALFQRFQTVIKSGDVVALSNALGHDPESVDTDEDDLLSPEELEHDPGWAWDCVRDEFLAGRGQDDPYTTLVIARALGINTDGLEKYESSTDWDALMVELIPRISSASSVTEQRGSQIKIGSRVRGIMGVHGRSSGVVTKVGAPYSSSGSPTVWVKSDDGKEWDTYAFNLSLGESSAPSMIECQHGDIVRLTDRLGRDGYYRVDTQDALGVSPERPWVENIDSHDGFYIDPSDTKDIEVVISSEEYDTRMITSSDEVEDVLEGDDELYEDHVPMTDPDNDPNYNYETMVSSYDKSRISKMPEDAARLKKLELYLRFLQRSDDAPNLAAVSREVSRLRAEIPQKEKTGPFSGLTKSELAASRTSEPDWF